jgi:RNA polymerase sigma-70 factor (ECF subfamily)
VRGADPVSDVDLSAQWEVVDAFIAAARGGDFDALVAVLDPDVVLRADGGRVAGLSQYVRGAEAVASQALMWARVDLTRQRAVVNGGAGMVMYLNGEPFSICAVTVKNGKLAELDFLADPERIAQLDLTVLDN